MAEVLIPHYNIKSDAKITVADSDSEVNRMFGISVDVTNRNIPVMSLLGQTR